MSVLPDPIIICCYVNDDDVHEIRRVFRLDQEAGRRLPVFFWKDEQLIGPELAYEHCWNLFPDRDIIILHTDMAPLPDDTTNQWYDDLLSYAARMPHAGLLGCDLLYPARAPDGGWYVQSGGGYIQNGEIMMVGGGFDAETGTGSEGLRRYGADLMRVRRVDWVTFGGIFIRRAVLTECGPLDRHYRWAYVRDVDYCLEARYRGFEIFQVPVTLMHFESRTMRRLQLLNAENNAKIDENYRVFYKKWDWWTNGPEH